MGVAAVSAGVTGGFSSEFGVTVDNQTLRPLASTDVTQRVGYAAINTLSKTSASVAINGGNVGSALVDNLRANIADQVQSVGSSAIGKSYFDGGLSYVEHKLSHAALGGASASIYGGNIASGALGASVAEATGEAAFGYGLLPSTSIDIAKLSGASVGLLTGDVNTASNSANLAAENNLAPFIVANSARAVAVEACVANPSCMAAASAIALETGKKLNEAVDYLIKISGTNPLPGFDVHTPEASVLTTPEHKSDWSLETLPIFDLYDSSLVTTQYEDTYNDEGFTILPDYQLNVGNILFKRPTPKESEEYIGQQLYDFGESQKSFKDGEHVKYGTKGSVRPDFCIGNTCAIEVKNYDLSKNQSALARVVGKQVIARSNHLPQGMTQEVKIDVRGQVVTDKQEKELKAKIVSKSEGIIKNDDIRLIRE